MSTKMIDKKYDKVYGESKEWKKIKEAVKKGGTAPIKLIIDTIKGKKDGGFYGHMSAPKISKNLYK